VRNFGNVVLGELSTPINDCVALTAPLRPEIVPSSVAKMKFALPDVVPFETIKSFALLLNTWPVGADVKPGGDPFGGAMVTTRGVPAGNGTPPAL